MFTEIQLKYEIVRVFMNKEIELAIEMCRNYINSKHMNAQILEVDDDFFQMLFDMYRINIACIVKHLYGETLKNRPCKGRSFSLPIFL